MRIAVAGFMHESNTFSPFKADRAAFQSQCLKLNGSFVEEWRHAHHEVGALIEGVEKEGHELLPIGMAWATPSGPVTDEVYEEVVGHFTRTLSDKSCDGLLLALHGAMVTETHQDADGETLRRIRQAVGPEFPIVVTLDLHANLSPLMIDNCTAAVTYRTNPHVDQRETGERAVLLLEAVLREHVKLETALSKPPLIISLARQDTSQAPLRSLFEEQSKMHSSDSVCWVADLALGFPYADVPHMGPGFLVIAEDAAYAIRKAEAFAEKLWDLRQHLTASLPDAKEAVHRALAAQRLPALLIDFGDNVGGGSAADGTVLLQELLRQNARGFACCLFDPQAVQSCFAGVGGRVQLPVGGKVDRAHGGPVEIVGRVRVLHDGNYIEPVARHGGRRQNCMGLSALVELADGNLLVLNSLRHPPFSLGQLTSLGIDPKQLRIIVVKAAIAYKAAYAPLGGTIIEVDTPGLTAVNPARFEYKHIRRPMFPLDV